MPFILEFSPSVAEALRPLSMVQHREVDERSPPVRITSVRCSRCGFEHDMKGTAETPSDTLRAVTLTHEFSWTTGERCGGQMEFVAEPVFVQPTMAVLA